MEIQQSAKRRAASVLIKLFVIALLVTACKKDPEVVPITPCFALDIQRPYGAEPPHYNLNVYFKGQKPTTCAYVEFRQEKDSAQFIHLDTWVHDLLPNTNYVLQRAVDTTIDGNCTSTTWLTLGKGLTAQSILTDANGEGYAELYRSVSMIAIGTTFDIHFQIVKLEDSTVALTSDCYQYTVR